MSSGGRTSGGRRGGRVGGSSGSVDFEPLAGYRYGGCGHMARDCPQAAQSQGSGNAVPSHGGFSKSGQKGPKSRGRGRSVRVSALNVLYDDEGNVYPVDDAGQLYVPLESVQTVGESAEEEITKDTKN